MRWSTRPRPAAQRSCSVPAEESLAAHRGVGLLRHRHARLLAPRPCALSQPRPALHRRAGLFPPRHQRGADHAGGAGAQAGRLPLRGVAPAQRQVSPARGRSSWASSRSRSKPACWCGRIGNTYAGSSLVGHDGRAGRGAAGRPGAGGVLRLRRGQRRLFAGGDRTRSTPPAAALTTRPWTTSRAASRSTMRPTRVFAARC